MAPSQAITVSYITNRKYRVLMKDLLIQGHFIYFKGKKYNTVVAVPDCCKQSWPDRLSGNLKKKKHTHTKKTE